MLKKFIIVASFLSLLTIGILSPVSAATKLDDAKYHDKTSYTDPDKYTTDQIKMNETFGFDFAGALNDAISSYYNDIAERDAISAASQKKEKDRIIAAEKKVVTVLKKKGSKIKDIRNVWTKYNSSDMIEIWITLGYKDKILLWPNLNTLERSVVYPYLFGDEIRTFFDQLDSTQKMDVWHYAMNDEFKTLTWGQLRYINEDKPMELWRSLSDYDKAYLYSIMRSNHKDWLKEHMTDDEKVQLQNLLDNPPSYDVSTVK
jgi:hypothetical protein